MYCPNCGTENVETNKFCRACRENLKVVSQAMKQQLPVVLASRFDQMLDSRSERFRRDSVISFLIGLIFLAARWSRSGAFGNSYGDFGWILLIQTPNCLRRRRRMNWNWRRRSALLNLRRGGLSC